MAHRIRLTLTTLFLTACGLDIVGTAAPLDASAPGDADNGELDGAVVDSGSDAPAAPDACAATCPVLALVGGGFAPIGFGDASGACPAGFTSEDVVEKPVAQAGACTCGACAVAGASCAGGFFHGKDGNDSACNDQTSGPLSTFNGSCAPGLDFNESFIAIVPPPPANMGTCSAASAPVRSAVVTTAHRICTPAADPCSAGLCALAAPFAGCLAAPGDKACPAGASKKHLVAKDFTLSCGPCGCTPTVTCGGSLAYWGNSGCGGGPTQVLQANQCTQLMATTSNSTRWTSTINPTCATTPPKGAVGLAADSTQTVCCP